MRAAFRRVPAPPAVDPGWTSRGVVSDVDPAVTTVRPGDRVLAYDREDHVQCGTFAQRTAVPERAIAKILPGMSIAEAAPLPDRVREVAPGGVDVVIDLVGGETLADSRVLLADGGRIASIADPQVLQLGGSYVFVRPDAAMLSRLAELVSSGEPVVGIAGTYPLDATADGLRASKSVHTRGKIVITML